MWTPGREFPGDVDAVRDADPPVVVTLLGVTLSLPDRNDNAPSPAGRDDLRVPNGTQESVQPQKGGDSPRHEHLSVDATPCMSFPAFRLGNCPLTFL